MLVAEYFLWLLTENEQKSHRHNSYFGVTLLFECSCCKWISQDKPAQFIYHNACLQAKGDVTWVAVGCHQACLCTAPLNSNLVNGCHKTVRRNTYKCASLRYVTHCFLFCFCAEGSVRTLLKKDLLIITGNTGARSKQEPGWILKREMKDLCGPYR